MTKNKMIAVAGIVILILIILNLAVRKKGNEESIKKESKNKESVGKKNVDKENTHKWYFDRDYIIDNKYEIKLKDIQTFYERPDFSDANVRNYFAENIINAYTLSFLNSMDGRFNDSKDLADHLEKARQYLYSVLPYQRAGEMLALYKTYVNYKIELNRLIDRARKAKKLVIPSGVDELIADLHDLQKYRRAIFGREIADALFGAGVKAEEYPIRRSAIMNDKDLYGAEKEYRLKQLDRDMWGDEADSVRDNIQSYTRYQEKLQIYQKDLSEMGSEEAKQAKMREFRREIFTPGQVQRLDEVDRNIANEKKREEDYFAGESAIKNDASLSEQEKETRIRELQDETFGEEADAFRRRQAIKAGTEQLLKERAEQLKR
jgi:lipase chaperone LimK